MQSLCPFSHLFLKLFSLIIAPSFWLRHLLLSSSIVGAPLPSLLSFAFHKHTTLITLRLSSSSDTILRIYANFSAYNKCVEPKVSSDMGRGSGRDKGKGTSRGRRRAKNKDKDKAKEKGQKLMLINSHDQFPSPEPTPEPTPEPEEHDESNDRRNLR